MANRKRFKIIIPVFIAIFVLGTIMCTEFFLSSKEKRAQLMGLARRLLERPREMKAEVKKTEAPQAAPSEILVDDFSIGLTSGVAKGRKNRLGAYQGTYSMRPSFSIISKSKNIRPGGQGQALVIDYKKEAGWCGWYTLLNNIDVTAFNTLSFWVRGENGSEKFDIGLGDARMQDLAIDAVYLGCVTSFIPDGFVTKEWKEVKVPVSRVSSAINLSKMGSLVFNFKYGGSGRIYVGEVKFKNDPEISKIEDYNAPRAVKDPQHPRSLWVWKIDPVSSVKQRKDLFELCKRANISNIYLFFPEFNEAPPADYVKSLSEYLKESHAVGTRVEALTGNPVWSLTENHKLCTNWIKFFLEYNKGRPQEEQIDGVSLDVEPYLTAEWQQDKERIKKDYIELLRKCRELIDGYHQQFRIGVAIPFFYDKEDDGNFERSILKYVDYAALMVYYDTSKYIIDYSKTHIALANEQHKKVVVAVETQDLVEMHQGKRRNTFYEEGWEEMERRLDKVRQQFITEPSFEGFAIHHYDSYKLLTRGKNVPTNPRSEDYIIKARRAAKPVMIDGKLDNWNLSAPYIIEDEKYVVYGRGAWKGPDDLSYKIYSVWDENALYFAIDVRDNKVFQEKTGGDMWEGDHVELWIDADLQDDPTEAMNSEDDFQIGLSPGNFSNLKPEVFIWTPELPDNLKYKDLIDIAATKTEKGYLVEVKVPKEVLFYMNEKLRLSKGFKLGIMVDVGDTDDPANPMKCLMSTSVSRIWGDPTTFGILELDE